MKNKRSIRENYILILAHWERRLRLCSGLILVAFVVPHLTNHALGIFSFEAMEALRDWLALVWRSTAGTILLYGAMASHFALALYSLFRRTTLRIPAWEATQLILGLAIIPLLAFHAIFNRMVWELTTTEVDYHLVIATIWYTDFETWRIMLLVLVVWVHLAIGLHFWGRVNAHYPKLLPFLYAISVLLPVLALLGFIRSGLNPAYSGGEKYVDQMLNSPSNTELQFILSLESVTLWTFLVLLLGVLLAREVKRIYARRHGVFRLQHAGGNSISVPVGRSILEALRAAGIPHAYLVPDGGHITYLLVRVPRYTGQVVTDPDGAAPQLDPPGFALWSASELDRRNEALGTRVGPDGSSRETLADYGPGGVAHRFRFLRRERSGPPELHDDVIDVVLIQSGAGILRVGGDMIGESNTAGAAISGGELFPVNAGDVLHIPANIPHGYVVPDGHITYVLVRVPIVGG